MILPVDSGPVVARLESALEAGCAALVALQTLPGPPASGAGDLGGVGRQIRHMTNVLRATIDDLRAVGEYEPSLLAFGFVLAPEAAGGGAVGRSQVSPRRTA